MKRVFTHHIRMLDEISYAVRVSTDCKSIERHPRVLREDTTAVNTHYNYSFDYLLHP